MERSVREIRRTRIEDVIAAATPTPKLIYDHSRKMCTIYKMWFHYKADITRSKFQT